MGIATKMSITKSAASLQKAYLQAANSFAAYNFKEYFVRQANIRFANPPAEGSANYQSWVKSTEKDIEQLKRCAFTNTMYEAPRLVVEDKGQKMMQGGGGAGVEAA